MKITNELLLERLQYLENKQYSENTIEAIRKLTKHKGNTGTSRTLRHTDYTKLLPCSEVKFI